MKNRKHLLAVTGLVMALGLSVSQSAKADDGHGRDRWEHGRWEHGHGHHHGHWKHRNYTYYGYPGQYVVYQPMPRYIAPPPPVVYYPAPQPSGINLIFPMRFD